MQIKIVESQADQKAFIQVSVIINKNNTNWIRPLDKDINQVFDKEKNKAFRFGELQRWLLQDNAGNFIGRVAAFVYKKYKNKGDDMPVGGMGFFECIDDQQAANLLFDTAKKWLQERDMEAMDGPINFGERDKWWGLVTEGFEPPLYCLNFNPPFYVKLFENYGFKVFYNQICAGFDVQSPLSEKIIERHAVIKADKDFSVHLCDKSKLEKYAEDFSIVYNKAWAGHGGLKQMAKEQVLIMFKQMKPIMDEKLMYFAYHKSDPIGIFINIPDINQYFKYMNGKFGLLEKIKFFLLTKFRPTSKMVGVIFGVVPEFQGKGVDAYLIGESRIVLQAPPYHYKKLEMQWIGDFNPKMLNVVDSFGNTYRSRNLSTYRFIFDREKPFVRHPMLA